MIHEPSYVWEKLMASVTSMAVSPELLRERLRNVWFDQLGRLQSDRFPDELQDLKREFSELEQVLNDPNSNALLAAMTDDEVYVFARKITSLYDQVCTRVR